MLRPELVYYFKNKIYILLHIRPPRAPWGPLDSGLMKWPPLGAVVRCWVPLGAAGHICANFATCSCEQLTMLNPQFVAGEHGLFGGHKSEDIRTFFIK